MALQKRPKLAVADTTDELQFIEQFGRPLGIKDIAGLKALQTAAKHVVIISPVGRGRYEIRYETTRDVLLVSRQPLLEAARMLLASGCNPDAVLSMRRRTLGSDDLKAPLRVAALYTVDETRTVFVKWKPFCLSAVSKPGATKQTSAVWIAWASKPNGQRDRRRANRVQPECPNPTDNEQFLA
jgi:hypothetical protein